MTDTEQTDVARLEQGRCSHGEFVMDCAPCLRAENIDLLSRLEQCEAAREPTDQWRDMRRLLTEFEESAWDGDPLRRRDDPLCQRARALLESLPAPKETV